MKIIKLMDKGASLAQNKNKFSHNWNLKMKDKSIKVSTDRTY